ncbi:hypothetical protein [Hahella ganghwensis]|uniref:hypothetical protein n=1 Tax=Hahella ganghwensis TaxID=286420 RepID=UPI000378DBB2|nr:hypothetical protein [Hahella ganghwensis]
MANLKWCDYILVPGFQIVRITKEEDNPVSVKVKNEYGLVLVGTNVLIVSGLLIFVAIPYVKKHGVFPA